MIIPAIILAILLIVGKIWLAKEEKKNAITSHENESSENKNSISYDGGHNGISKIDNSTRTHENHQECNGNGEFTGNNPYIKNK